MRLCSTHFCVVFLAILAAACSRQGGISTARVEAAFEMVGDTNRVLLDEAFALVHARKYPDALDAFRRIESTYRVTPVQEMALQDLIGRLEARVPQSKAASDTPVDVVTNPPPRQTPDPR